jgi:hypothetical protein
VCQVDERATWSSLFGVCFAIPTGPPGDFASAPPTPTMIETATATPASAARRRRGACGAFLAGAGEGAMTGGESVHSLGVGDESAASLRAYDGGSVSKN